MFIVCAFRRLEEVVLMEDINSFVAIYSFGIINIHPIFHQPQLQKDCDHLCMDKNTCYCINVLHLTTLSLT